MGTNANLASRMGYEPERTMASGAIIAGYTLMGALFTHPIRILVLQNNTNAGVSFSLDGINTLITLQPGVDIVLDITANRTNNPAGFMTPINWGVYAKLEIGAATTGSIYASAIYGAGPEPTT